MNPEFKTKINIAKCLLDAEAVMGVGEIIGSYLFSSLPHKEAYLESRRCSR